MPIDTEKERGTKLEARKIELTRFIESAEETAGSPAPEDGSPLSCSGR
jgi:hypothetical protein